MKINFAVIGVAIILYLSFMSMNCSSSSITKRGIAVGDTVVVSVLTHGHHKGIVMAKYEGSFYIDFFSVSRFNAWYDDYAIKPYSKLWDKLNKKVKQRN